MNAQNTRDKILTPISRLATNYKLTPNMISIAGVISMIVFGMLIYWHVYVVSLLFLALSIFADLFDGSLARFQKKESDAGRKMDLLTDTISFDVFLFALGFAHLLAFSVAVLIFILHIILTNKNTKTAFTNAATTRTKMYDLHGFWILPNIVKSLMYISFIIGIFSSSDMVPLMRLAAIIILAFGIIKR